ncbi:cytochrome c6 PetJ [Gloeocapsopsis sp. IPPAS B-1203]|uniref:cytochrome c6 PetJ n=1 Tax=Gloeocapsopsis sp. IPPAS B-1203 TaxID=2049454 RepID=UPI000C198F75|nr:c-type cytochrome [Gloeocapsopsis sp. IPPAS B-1203]PIG91395.1 cytochrome C6 [Gloeocapsopsis sp. IPPAS B-1203]
MKKLLSLVVLAIAILIFGATHAALAETNGARIFQNYCWACHMGGGNVIIAYKTLKLPALEKYKMNSMAAIVNQVRNGKSAMPAFRGRLSEREIQDVAAYVLIKADTGW